MTSTIFPSCRAGGGVLPNAARHWLSVLDDLGWGREVLSHLGWFTPDEDEDLESDVA